MYPIDFVVSFSGLTEGKIKTLETKGIVKPVKKGGIKYYPYQDICVLRVMKILREKGLSLKNIEIAYEFLKGLKEDKELSGLILFHDGKKIYDLTDDPAIIATQYGQIVNPQLLESRIQPVLVGPIMEKTRRKIVEYSQDLDRRKAEPKRKMSMKDIKSLMSA